MGAKPVMSSYFLSAAAVSNKALRHFTASFGGSTGGGGQGKGYQHSQQENFALHIKMLNIFKYKGTQFF